MFRWCLIAAALGLFGVRCLVAADSAVMKEEFIFEQAPFPSCHASTIVETKNDGLVVAWFGGAKEGAADVGIWLSRQGAGKWTQPVEVARGAGVDGKPLPCWNPVLFQPETGPLMLFYKVGQSFTNWWGMLITSGDGGKTWSTARRLPEGILGPIKNKPVQLLDGTILCGSSTEPGGWRVHFEQTPDLGQTWTKTEPINDGKTIGAIQPSLLIHPGGRIEALGRSQQGTLWQAWSGDQGKSWGEMTLLDVPNPNSGTDAVALKDGRFLLVYNHTPRGRTPLNVAVSADGVHWDAVLTLENGDGEFSYPAVIEAKDGLVHVTYTWQRKRVRHVVIDPAKLVAPSAEIANPTERLSVLHAGEYRHFVEDFNEAVPEDVANAVPNALAWDWMVREAPFFDCPDADFVRSYYYRWWVFRRHLKHTPEGWNMSEFILPVNWADKNNAIVASAGFGVLDGRWLQDSKYTDALLRFWFDPGPDGQPRGGLFAYSNFLPWAAYQRFLADGRKEALVSLLPGMLAEEAGWEQRRLAPDGLFWQYDVRDGMEESISGSRTEKNLRAPLNSYQYGNDRATAATARLAGDASAASRYEQSADKLKGLVQGLLWDTQAGFFKVRHENGALSDARELHGFLPWMFDLPGPEKGTAWREFNDPQGFSAPFGLTTAEQRHPGFAVAYTGHDCQWNGPVWPFATAQTLLAAANVLEDYPPQQAVTKAEYFQAFTTFAHSLRRKLPDGRTVAWIDEDQDPFTGAWIAREIKLRNPLDPDRERGAQYNHSSFADLVVTGLVGLRPDEGKKVVVNPLVPSGTWDWFCLDGLPYHGRTLAVVWDKDGRHYGKGAGLTLLVNGQILAARPDLGRLESDLPTATDR